MGTLVHGAKIGVLAEILKPEGIEVADGRLYVVEGPVFFVYNLNNPTLIKKFGQAGEGPGELNTVLNFPNSLRILEDKIIAEGFNKIIIFSKDFKFLKEFRKKEMLLHKITPIKENFVAVRMTTGKNKIIFTLLLLDPEMNVIKELHKQESFDRQKELIMVRDTIHFEIYNDKIYVSTFVRKDNKEKCIIMDLNGNIIGTSYLPITGQSSFSASSMGKNNRFYGIAGNKFYYLKENEDEEVWELHAAEIK
jgi:hypothetical protein